MKLSQEVLSQSLSFTLTVIPMAAWARYSRAEEAFVILTESLCIVTGVVGSHVR
jgi:hypothetical protein